jgi:2,4-dienoyl-CoA reductase-like NADH-dependent reductase (Old Yellow Enzyme family)
MAPQAFQSRAKFAVDILNAAIKKMVSIPVVVLGSLDAEHGGRILREGWADLIGYGRALLADPELPKKVIEGRPKDIRPCMHCIQCLGCYDDQKLGGLLPLAALVKRCNAG